MESEGHSVSVEGDHDRRHLWWLQLFHVVNGVLKFIVALFPGAFVAFGSVILYSPDTLEPYTVVDDHELTTWGRLFFWLGVGITVYLLTYGVLQILVAWSLWRRRWWRFCMAISCVDCLNVPFGALLGVLTIVVLIRPTVKVLFGREERGIIAGDDSTGSS